MSKISHINTLKMKHSDLEKSIANENRRPLPNTHVLFHLKQKKLRIKDEIANMNRR